MYNELVKECPIFCEIPRPFLNVLCISGKSLTLITSTHCVVNIKAKSYSCRLRIGLWSVNRHNDLWWILDVICYKQNTPQDFFMHAIQSEMLKSAWASLFSGQKLQLQPSSCKTKDLHFGGLTLIKSSRYGPLAYVTNSLQLKSSV